MSTSYFKTISCGETIPQKNIHAVSTSMPTLKDVIDYEEQNPSILNKITIAYPRFLMHPYLKKLSSYLKEKYKIDSSCDLIVLNSKNAVKEVCIKYNIFNDFVYDEPFGIVKVSNEDEYNNVLKFIQHTGHNLSSRASEDYLFKIKLINNIQNEDLVDEKIAKDVLISNLSSSYKQPKDNIYLSSSGMNSIFYALKAVKKIQKENNRNILIQFGLLYLDTMNIIENYFEKSKAFYNIENLDLLEEYFKTNGKNVSCVITEVPTNPLIQTVDLFRLKKLCDEYNIILIIDNTFATSYNINLNDYADIYIESLTKFASGHADVLMGSIVLNEKSSICQDIKCYLKDISQPYIKDIQRLAFEINDYKKRIKIISKNTKELAIYFENSSYIDEVFYCLSPKYKSNYENIMLDENSICGIISVTFKKDFEKIYDNLNFPKGPSLGTEFTLLMPYTYLAHYDLIKSEDGEKLLEQINLPIELLRISVGTEPIEEIIKEFERINEFLSTNN